MTQGRRASGSHRVYFSQNPARARNPEDCKAPQPDLAKALRSEHYGEVYGFAGPAFVQDNGTNKPQTIRFIGPSRVLAPIHFFRIHSIILDGKFDVMSFLVPNQPALDPDVTKYLVSVDRIEAVAGLTFFGSLPKAGCAIVKSTTTSRSRASPASF